MTSSGPSRSARSGLRLVRGVMGLVLVALPSCGGSSSKSPTAEPVVPRVGSWATAGSLGEARGGQTESTLANGNVLIAGGQPVDPNAAIKSAEIFDAATGKWKPTNGLATPRTGHTATVLDDGRVLVVGGIAVNSAELYDPATGAWSPAGTVSGNRFNHTATRLLDGKVLIAGGFAGADTPSLASAELYDPATNSWSVTAPMAGNRGAHTASLLADGKVLVAAGNAATLYRRSASDATTTTAAAGFGTTTTSGEGEVATAELYDPTTRSWSATGALKAARSSHTATVLKDGRVLVVGGFSPDGELDSAEIYHPSAGTWSTATPLDRPRTIHAAALLPDGQVLVAGGQVGSSGSVLSSTLQSATLYDPAADTWRPAADMATPRTGHSATTLASGKVLIVGGLNPSGAIADTELFSLEAKAGT